jgi:hypothetical protein
MAQLVGKHGPELDAGQCDESGDAAHFEGLGQGNNRAFVIILVTTMMMFVFIPPATR